MLFGEVARGLFSTIGSFLIGLTIVGLILLGRATFSFIALAQRIQRWFVRLRVRAGHGVGKVGQAWVEARVAERERRQEELIASEPLIASPEQADAIIAAFADDGDGGLPPWLPRRSVPHKNRPTPTPAITDVPQTDVDDPDDVPTPSPIMPEEPVSKRAVRRATHAVDALGGAGERRRRR